MVMCTVYMYKTEVRHATAMEGKVRVCGSRISASGATESGAALSEFGVVFSTSQKLRTFAS